MICAPTGAFLMLLICWSLSVSFENLTGGAGDVRFEGAGFTGVGLEEFCFAMLVRVDWHFSCCFLNLFKLSCKDAIWRKNKTIKNYYQEHRWTYGSRTWFTVSADSPDESADTYLERALPFRKRVSPVSRRRRPIFQPKWPRRPIFSRYYRFLAAMRIDMERNL